MQEFETVRCEHNGVQLEGFSLAPDGDGPFPTVLLFPGATGTTEANKARMRELAGQGFLTIATDMYGADSDMSSDEAAGRHFMRLLEDPDLLRARTTVWFEAAARNRLADAERIAAIGYCFGGRCVLELARSGADVKAVVSFHGLLTTHAPAQSGAIRGEVVAYCAGRDPYAPVDHVEMLRRELADAKARHQITLFSEAEHSFTDPDAASHRRDGISYHPLADRLSWEGTLALLNYTLKA